MITKNDNSLKELLKEFDSEDALIYGIGNVGREDDGLGWAFVDFIEEHEICVESELVRGYQLHLEDADLISTKRKVLFVDATKKNDVRDFSLSEVEPKMDITFTSHAISAESIVATCKLCFVNLPEVYLLEIKGYSWELKVGLTPGGEANLNAVMTIWEQ